nr:hypothetical protein [Tanacetum cinerariifolium]
MAYTSGSNIEVKSCFKNYAKTYEKLQKQFDEQRQTLNKANLEIVAYQLGLESVKAQLIVHQKNEVAYEKKIAVLEFEVKDKDNAITRLTNQLDQTLMKKEDLKAKLEQFEISSKNLNKLINSQPSAKDKTGLGYGDQLSESDREVLPSVFDSRSSDGDDNPTNDRFKKSNGYHAVPPPFIRNYMPPLVDLSFAGLDDSVYRPTTNKASANISKVHNTRISKETVNIVRINSVNTAGQTLVSIVVGNVVTAVKTLASCVWRPKVGDESVHKDLGDRMERAATTASSLEAEQDSGAQTSTIKDGVMAITDTIDRNVKLLITEASIRRHIKLVDYEGLSILPTKEIFQQLALIGVHSLGRNEGSLSLNELTVLYTSLSIKVQSLENELQQTKKGRSLIKELDMDVDISLVPPHAADQGIKSDDTQVSDQPEDQLGVFTVAKVLADAAKQGRSVGNVQTYTRQRRRVNTASKVVMQEFAPTKKIKKRIQVQMSIDEELAQKLHEEELARTVQEVERRSTKEEKGKISDDSSKPTRKKTLSRKRANGNDSQESVKKQKLEDDTKKKELKAYLDIVPDDEFVMEVESLATKYLIIDWKTHVLTEHFMYYQIIRADGSSKNYKIFSEMLDDFNIQDVMDLHRLVEERYTTTSPEGYDLMLWGDLKTLFEPDEESELWKNQHEYNLISWRLCDSSGIHILLMDNGIAIHMLIEKKYPLGQEMISKMLNKRLEVKQESEMTFELLSFIRSQV